MSFIIVFLDKLPIVEGYTARRGECPEAKTIAFGDYTSNLKKCAQNCNLRNGCVAFLQSKNGYCYLKKNTCEETTVINEENIFYDKGKLFRGYNLQKLLFYQEKGCFAENLSVLIIDYYLITDKGPCRHSISLDTGGTVPLFGCYFSNVASQADCRAKCSGFLSCVGYQYKDSPQMKNNCMIYSSYFRCPNGSRAKLPGTMAQTTEDLIGDIEPCCDFRDNCDWSCYGRDLSKALNLTLFKLNRILLKSCN